MPFGFKEPNPNPRALVVSGALTLGVGQFAKLTGPSESLALLQNDSGRWLQAQGLATDGGWVLTLRQNHRQLVCFQGGTRTQVSWENKPVELHDAGGHVWPDWEWSEGKLTMHQTASDQAICLTVVE